MVLLETDSGLWMDDTCFYLHDPAVAPLFILFEKSDSCRAWLVLGLFSRLCISSAAGGGAQRLSFCLPLTGTSLCFPVCQTYRRWSRIIPSLLLRRGDPGSLTCPPTPPMRETLPGKTDARWCLLNLKYPPLKSSKSSSILRASLLRGSCSSPSSVEAVVLEFYSLTLI